MRKSEGGGEATLLQVCRGGYRATGPIATSTSGSAFSERGDRIDGKGGNRGGIFLRRDFDERLEVVGFGECVGVGHSL